MLFSKARPQQGAQAAAGSSWVLPTTTEMFRDSWATVGPCPQGLISLISESEEDASDFSYLSLEAKAVKAPWRLGGCCC